MDFSETTVVRFRSALGGFHKGDVTNYISQTVSAYRDTVRKLTDQIKELEEENADLRNAAADGAYLAELEEKAQQLIALQEENGLLKNRVHQLEYKLEEADAQLTVAEPEEENLQEKELEAYRRAEAMERRVNQRTHQMTLQLDKISDDAAHQFQTAIESVKTVLAGIEDYLETLRNTSENLDTAMAEGLERLQSTVVFLPGEDDAQ
jgi:chromosome segregation ATPase